MSILLHVYSLRKQHSKLNDWSRGVQLATTPQYPPNDPFLIGKPIALEAPSVKARESNDAQIDDLISRLGLVEWSCTPTRKAPRGAGDCQVGTQTRSIPLKEIDEIAAGAAAYWVVIRWDTTRGRQIPKLQYFVVERVTWSIAKGSCKCFCSTLGHDHHLENASNSMWKWTSFQGLA